MRHNYFTDEEIEILSKSRWVKNVTKSVVHFNEELEELYVKQIRAGVYPTAFFRDLGLYEIIGQARVDGYAGKVRRKLEIEEVEKRFEKLETPEYKFYQQKLLQKDLTIQTLKKEVELLKKLDYKERKAINHNQKIDQKTYYSIVEQLSSRECYKRKTGYICKLVGIPRSSYYYYLSTQENRANKEKEERKDLKIIEKAFNFGGYKKGIRGVKMVLECKYHKNMNLKKIERLMNKYGITSNIRKKHKNIKYLKEFEGSHIAENLVDRNFKQEAPFKVLLTDITYLSYGKQGINRAYLSMIIDALTTEILAYSVSKSLRMPLVMKTLQRLVNNKNISLPPECVLHSDQGVHYTSNQYQNFLKDHGIKQSMSRRGNCWDNAPQESRFGHLKDEVDLKKCNTFEQLCQKIKHYVTYHNYSRYQWGLNKKTPVEYRNELIASMH